MNDARRSEAAPESLGRKAGRLLALSLVWTLMATMLPRPAYAALTDLSPQPIAANAAAQTKPNVMLLMDTSGSMGWTHMPDEVESITGIGSIGYKSSQCNAIYYNPQTTYDIPKKADGTLLTAPAFGAAPYAGYVSYFAAPTSTELSTTNLATSFRAYDTNTLRATTAVTPDPAQPAYYYVYTGPQTLRYDAPACVQSDVNTSTAANGGGTWTRVLVSSTSGIATRPDERANFAAWYSFYRTRLSLIKSAASLAFNPLTDSFRVGFITVEPKDSPTDAAINPNKYVEIADFNLPQRTLWYNRLFSQPAKGASPAREGLARVGRHYAGMHDGINTGMTGDPVQYSCQQNFTIMTTDGYWNSQTETPGAGPVKIDGVAKVGQQDGTFTPFPGYTSRPIWEGFATDTVKVTDNNNLFGYTPCGTYYTKSTEQISKTTTQNVEVTTKSVERRLQTLQDTIQWFATQDRTDKVETQHRIATTRVEASTSQWSRSTYQMTETTTAFFERVEQLQMRQERIDQSTTQRMRSTSQTTASTSQQMQSTLQTRIATSRTDQSTSQNVVSTSRTDQSTRQVNSQTYQTTQSTSQTLQSTTQVRQRTSQDRTCDSRTEDCTPVATGSCSASGFFYCETVTTGPTLVASCTADTAKPGNNYTTTTCTPTTTGPTPVASCTPIAASSGNSYTRTDCTPNNTGPTVVSSCSNQSPTSGNGYTTTSCNTAYGALTPTASCTTSIPSSSNSYTGTNCPVVTSAATPVSSCTPAAANSGNSYTETVCTPVNTGPTGVSSCSSSGPTSGNSWTTTSCNPVTTGPTPVSSCTAASASSGNNWVTTTCTPVTTGPTPIASCSPISAASGNSWTTTTCPNVSSAPVPVASCTPVSGNSGNSFTATVCPVVTTGPTGVASCSYDAPTSTNSYTETTCNPVSTGPTAVLPASCPSSQAPSSGNGYTTITCNDVTSGPTPVASCSTSGPSAGNGYVGTTCNTVVVSDWADVGSCNPQGANAGNGYVSTLCRSRVVSQTPSGTCVPSTVNGVVTTCPSVVTGPRGVLTCVPESPNAGNGYVQRDCNPVSTGPTLVPTCSNSGPTVGNQYTTTTCVNNTSGPTPVASCTDAPAGPGNSFTTTTCTTYTTGPSPSGSCSPISPTSGNNYTTTYCPDLIIPTTGAQTCSAQTSDSGNNWTDITCTPVTIGPTAVASCSEILPGAGNSWTHTTCTSAATGPDGVSSCTAQAPNSGNNYVRTNCNPTSVDTASGTCSVQAATSANNWVEIQCPTLTSSSGVAMCNPDQVAGPGNAWTGITCTGVVTGPTLTDSCSAGSASNTNNYTSTACNSVTTGPVTVTSCTAESANTGNNFTRTDCTFTPGKKVTFQTTTTVDTTPYSGGVAVGPTVRTTSVSGTNDLDGVCYAPGTEPGLPAPNPQKAGLAAGPAPTGTCTAWPCTVSTANAGGSVNSLADVAQYYYVTDLRPTMTDDVIPLDTGSPEGDRATWQHMTTFTIGLGVSGTLKYRPDYKSSAATTGDFADIRSGAKNWPIWPDPALNYDPATGGSYANWNDPRAIDDFWHTAVNGRGTYFSADKPQTVVTGLAEALSGVFARTGSGAGITVSNADPVAGDNFAYATTYKTQQWFGDVQAYDIDVVTGLVSTTPNWSAQTKLDLKTGAACDNRSIYLMRPAAANGRTNFSYGTRACDAGGNPTGPADTGLNATEMAYFTKANAVQNLSQYLSMTDGTGATVDQRTIAADANLVNYLRGQRGLEAFTPNDATKLYRAREHVLGDVVNGQPVYVRAPFASYGDAGYSAFKTANATRAPMLYVPANDGMLHAFYAGTSSGDSLGGQEAWAFVPQSMLGKLYKLADANYKNIHEFFVDGTPVAGDVYSGGTWRTIVVGGLNGGGKSYYAVDVTDPTNPKGLWEFQHSSTCYNGTAATAGADCHLGFTYGKPVITKLVNGTWVVMFTSGYNNVNSTPTAGDGGGYLYVLDAVTGQILYKIATGVGDSTTPSGLAQINAFVDYTQFNNTVRQVYGGDLLGNIWRFDVNDAIAPSGREAALIGVAKDGGGNAQPITTRPELAELSGKPMMFVGTGRLLGASDFGDASGQSVYGIVDPGTAAPVYSNLRSSLKPLSMSTVGSGSTATRTVACTGTTVQCGSTSGWVVDLPDLGERVNVEMKLSRGTLVFASNVPSNSACKTGGYSWLNFLNFASGQSVSTSPGQSVSIQQVDSLATGVNVITVSGGIPIAVRQFTSGVPRQDRIWVDTPGPSGKRITWREIAQ